MLVVDTDPQANATSGLGIDPFSQKGTMYDVFMSVADEYPKVPLSDIIIPTPSGIFLAPSALDLVGVEPYLYPVEDRYKILQKEVDLIRSQYDFIFIDTPPSMGQFVINGLIAADRVIMTFDRGIFSLHGLAGMELILGDISDIIGSKVRIDMAILTRWSASPVQVRESGVITFFKRLFPDLPSEEVIREQDLLHEAEKAIRAQIPLVYTIPTSNLVYESQKQGLPLSHAFPESEVAVAYKKAADEVFVWEDHPGVIGPAPSGSDP